MKEYLRKLGPVIVICLFAGAVYLLWHKLKSYSLEQIASSIHQIPIESIVLSILLMIINYIILIGYDGLALLAINKRFPIQRVALVSLVGQSVSYNFGALLGGTSIRYRFYSAWGFKLDEILRLILMLAISFWVGVLGFSGLIFMVAPPNIPQDLLDLMPIKDIRLLGGFLFSIVILYIGFCFKVNGVITLFGKEFFFPGPKIATAQVIVAIIDVVAASACMFVLLPQNGDVTFLQFIPSYLMAQVAVVLTHVPGGVGIFELVIIHLIQTADEKSIVAAMLLFRLIYYILPLLVAAVVLAIYELRQSKNMFRETGRAFSVISNTVSAYMTFAAGCIFLVSSTLPTLSKTVAKMADVPVWILHSAHALCAICGAFLLFIAYGVERRQHRAFLLALLCLLLGMLGAVCKGLSWITVGTTCIVLIVVLISHKRFYRSSFFWEESISANWLMGAFSILFGVFIMAWAIYHPLWKLQDIFEFDRNFNAVRTLRSWLLIVIALSVSWLWRIILRRNSLMKLKNKNKEIVSNS